MSKNYAGDFPAGHTGVTLTFDSFAAATGASSAASNFVAGDVQIYKDGGVTQRSSSVGITVTTSFDSNAGLQMIVIDTSDNTDAGFYAAGHEYDVAVADITIDAQTVRFWAGSFSIERAGGVLALIKGNAIKVDVNTIKTQAVTAAAGVTFPTSIASPTNITAGTITTATNLTNAPTAGDFTATMKTSIGTAVSASAVASVTGNVGGNVVGSVASVVGAVGSVTGLTASNLDTTISSRASATNLAVVAGYVDTEITDIQNRLPAALVGGRMDSSVGAMAVSVALTAGERNSVADALLARNVAGGSSSGRIVSEAFYTLRNKVAIAAGTMTVYGVDDTSAAFTAAVTTAAGNPISIIDPA